MKVKLISHTPEAERKVAMAARLCYSAIGAAELEERLSENQVQTLVEKILDMGHFSTLEHVSFTFAVEGVSRVLTHQLVRHRIASYSQNHNVMSKNMILNSSFHLLSRLIRRHWKSSPG